MTASHDESGHAKRNESQTKRHENIFEENNNIKNKNDNTHTRYDIGSCFKSKSLFNFKNRKENFNNTILEDKLTNSANFSPQKSPNLSLKFNIENIGNRTISNANLKQDNCKNEIRLRLNLFEAKNEVNLEMESSHSKSLNISNNDNNIGVSNKEEHLKENPNQFEIDRKKSPLELKLVSNTSKNYDVLTLD